MSLKRFREQFQQIQRALDFPLALGPRDAPEWIYEKGHVLARDEDAGLVYETIREEFSRSRPGRERQVRWGGPRTNAGGVARIQVGDPATGDEWRDDDVADALRAVEARARRAGRRLLSRNHLVTITPNACPGDEPVPVAPDAPLNPAVADEPGWPCPRVQVLVIDTGLVHDYTRYWWKATVTGDLELRELDGEGVLRQYVGHGTFIAGLIAAVARNAEVTVSGALDNVGAMTEQQLGAKLFEAVAGGWPDIISLSAGTSNGDARALLGLAPFMEALRAQPRTLLVAAAGNNGNATPFWPAAHAAQREYADAVVSVGALRTDGDAGACFTNYGPWVRVYAPGERLTSSFAGIDTPVPYDYQHTSFADCVHSFTYRCTCRFPEHVGELSEEETPTPAEPTRVVFDGYAQWSGTSFATPLVAAMVAQHMAAHPEMDPRTAARELLECAGGTAQVRGSVVAALRPETWSPTPVVELQPS